MIIKQVDSLKYKIQGKRILLLYARFFGYDVIVRQKLEDLGAEVDLYDARANINVVEKAIKKIIPSYYYRKQRRFHKKIQKRNTLKHYDYIFSNENIAIDILENYRKKFPNSKMILYLDDSIANMKGVEKTFYKYDRVFTFDRNDAQEQSIHFRPLFFSDSYKNKATESNYILEYDICFIGTCHSDRLKILEKIEKNQSYNLKFYFYCYLQSWFMYYYYRINNSEYRRRKKSFFSFKILPTDIVSKKMSVSTAILDIHHPKQTGLTMRTIEALGLGKKIITTNSDIVNYDFYDENNILIIDRNNPQINATFLQNTSNPIPDILYAKYSIIGWINNVFWEW